MNNNSYLDRYFPEEKLHPLLAGFLEENPELIDTPIEICEEYPESFFPNPGKWIAFNIILKGINLPIDEKTMFLLVRSAELGTSASLLCSKYIFYKSKGL